MFLHLELKQIRLLCPVLFGALIPVTFGLMLGWPSISFPLLLNNETSPIPITLDQSSMIAGFLMEGNSIGTLFCSMRFLSSKSAVSLSLFLQILGWFVMFGANDILGLFFSRFLVGLGNGFGAPQLKYYIKETCSSDLAFSLCKYLMVGMQVGVVFVYTMGIFLPFRTLALSAVAFPLAGFVGFTLIPKYQKSQSKFVRDFEMPQVVSIQSKPQEDNDKNVFQILKDSASRNALLLLLLIVFLQQYTGGAANVVYSQIIFTQSGNPYPKICSVVYALGFLIFTVIALRNTHKFSMKLTLVVSCLSVLLLVSLQGVYFYTKDVLLEISEYFTWGPLFVLVLFNMCHTFGIATIPLNIIDSRVPPFAKELANKFLVIHFSMSAVISTKIFQVLFTYLDMCFAYTFFALVAFCGFLITWLFVSSSTKSVNINRTNDVSVIEIAQY